VFFVSKSSGGRSKPSKSFRSHGTGGPGDQQSEAPNRRLAMAEREVQQTIAKYLLKDLRDELPGLVTVSKVRMSSDLRNAKVFISVFAPGENEAKLRAEAAKFLQACSAEIQDNLNSELQMRYVPKVTFIADDVIEKVLKVETILHEIGKTNASKKKDITDE
jgi:ribosome-binding factor A